MSEIRPRLPEFYGKYIKQLKNLSESELRSALGVSGENKSIEEKDGKMFAYYEGGVMLRTLEDAIDFFEIDLNQWQITRKVMNNWEGKTQVKLWLEPKQLSKEDVLGILMDHINSSKPRMLSKVSGGVGELVVGTSDFHFGADIKGLMRTKDFNLDVLTGYLVKIADEINKKGSEKVHLILCGDLIESFTGMNHAGVFKELREYGISAIIGIFELLDEYFFANIHNLESVNIVSGNHDRVTQKKDLDYKGEAAELLAFMIRERRPSIQVRYSPMVLSFQVGGTNYIITHGHHGLSKNDIAKTVFEYGQQGMFNMVIEGHLHSRIVKKAYKASKVIYHNEVVVQYDSLEFRKVVLSPLFTGNFYSEALGFSSNAGFTFFWEDEYSKPWVLDAMV